MNSIKLLLTLAVVLLSTAWLSGQKKTSSTTKTDTANEQAVCLSASTTFWENVIASDFSGRKASMAAINTAWDSHTDLETGACNDDLCDTADQKVKDYVFNKAWYTKAELAATICNAQRTYVKTYNTCIAVSATICNYVEPTPPTPPKDGTSSGAKG